MSERISVLREKNLLSIVILPNKKKGPLFLLFLWLMAWSVCGVIVFVNYFRVQDTDQRLFLFIYIAFWLYFEVSIVNVLAWKKWGREKLWIKNGVVHFQREMSGRGKIREINADLVQDIDLVGGSRTSFADYLSQSFWVKGNGYLKLTYQGREIVFGLQLTEAEAHAIRDEIRGFLR